MCKYEIDPMSIVEDTERTRFCPQTDRRTDRQTDTVIPVYPPFNFVEAGGIIRDQTYTITASEESFQYKDVKTVFTLKRAPLIRFVPAKYTGMLSQHMCCWETNVVGTWLEETQNHNRAARYYYQNSESTGISSRHYRVSCQWVTRLSGQHKLISLITILCRTVQKRINMNIMFTHRSDYGQNKYGTSSIEEVTRRTA